MNLNGIFNVFVGLFRPALRDRRLVEDARAAFQKQEQEILEQDPEYAFVQVVRDDFDAYCTAFISPGTAQMTRFAAYVQARDSFTEMNEALGAQEVARFGDARLEILLNAEQIMQAMLRPTLLNDDGEIDQSDLDARLTSKRAERLAKGLKHYADYVRDRAVAKVESSAGQAKTRQSKTRAGRCLRLLP